MVTVPPTDLVVIPAHVAMERVALRRPAGVIVRFEASVPHGARVVIDGVIPGVAGVRLSTKTASCVRHGAFDRCVQGEEGCPMPAAVWRFRVRRFGGPTGAIRLTFRVGPEPG